MNKSSGDPQIGGRLVGPAVGAEALIHEFGHAGIGVQPLAEGLQLSARQSMGAVHAALRNITLTGAVHRVAPSFSAISGVSRR